MSLDLCNGMFPLEEKTTTVHITNDWEKENSRVIAQAKTVKRKFITFSLFNSLCISKLDNEINIFKNILIKIKAWLASINHIQK